MVHTMAAAAMAVAMATFPIPPTPLPFLPAVCSGPALTIPRTLLVTRRQLFPVMAGLALRVMLFRGVRVAHALLGRWPRGRCGLVLCRMVGGVTGGVALGGCSDIIRGVPLSVCRTLA